MRTSAEYWTATMKFRRALFLIAALLPLTGFAGCPPTEPEGCQGSNCEGGGGESGSDSSGSSGGY
jgi:hypothetical protein